MKGKGERSVGEGGVKRPLNERKENVWKGRKAGCEPASLFVGDTLSTDGQWLHWIVLEKREKRKKRKRKIRLCSRIGRCVEEKKKRTKIEGKKERTMVVVRGGRRIARGRLLSFESRGSFPFTGDLPVLSTVDSSL